MSLTRLMGPWRSMNYGGYGRARFLNLVESETLSKSVTEEGVPTPLVASCDGDTPGS